MSFLRKLRNWFGRGGTRSNANWNLSDFQQKQAALLTTWFERASETGKPRGLLWLGYEILGEVVFVETGGKLLALMPVLIQFEPIPDGELADVPQAREPRPAVAVLEWRSGVWEPDNRAIFNLTPQQLLDREPNRYRRVSGSP